MSKYGQPLLFFSERIHGGDMCRCILLYACIKCIPTLMWGLGSFKIVSFYSSHQYDIDFCKDYKMPNVKDEQ